MTTAQEIAALQACVGNRLDLAAEPALKIAGVIGIRPSRYSRSPALWNAAFAATGIRAVYLPMDVEPSKLGELIRVLRDLENLLGINVTVPHKLAIMNLLDELDPGAARIEAVNTVVRGKDGRLTGYNTDGAGFLESIFEVAPATSAPFVEDLSGVQVLLLGAGGSARAVAFHIAECLGGGALIICNRTLEHATALASALAARGNNARAVGEDQLAECAVEAALIVNCTTKGQGSSEWESFSALAPILPDLSRAAALEDNRQRSLELAARIPPRTRFYDLIYHPEETVFLNHGRATGHAVMNGKGMIVCQAALAFTDHICADELRSLGMNAADTLGKIREAMYKAW
jgi:shikimate dehydrogenase